MCVSAKLERPRTVLVLCEMVVPLSFKAPRKKYYSAVF